MIFFLNFVFQLNKFLEKKFKKKRKRRKKEIDTLFKISLSILLLNFW